MRTQPTPDYNACALCFFHKVQSLKQEKCASSVDELIECVQQLLNGVHAKSQFDNFTTLQSVLQEILRTDGDNDIKITHSIKDARRRARKEIIG